MKLPTRWKELSPILDELLDLDPATRTAHLRRLDEVDSELAAELVGMLNAVEQASQHKFLERRPPVDPSSFPLDLKGMRIGAYRIESELGRGGSGSVWKAQRADGRFEGFVAIKLLHTALVGHHGVERFHREGAILSRLAHANIAHLLDAGVTGEGQPYLVLELVDGKPIDVYCDERRLEVRERLGLLLDVMSGVRHAHARLIVHRDLKPSNILVTPEGQVKLLDFGIAKLLQDELGDAMLTWDGQRALTPRYAAPEQLEGMPISTATDVYALGVLMYRLLVGRYPTAFDATSAAEVITGTLTTEPAPLGRALEAHRAEAEASPEELAERRKTSIKALRRAVRGDLDAIVRRALRKEPRERYESAAAFAADVERYLDGRAVMARAGSTRYRLGKFLRRHVAVSLASALLAVSVVVGLVSTTTQARRAQRERDDALHQLKGAESTREFVQFLLSEGADGEPVAPALLERGEKLVEREFANDPEDQARLQLLLARLYGEAGVQTRAEALLQRAARSVRYVDDANLKVQIECQLAWQVADNGQFEQALTMFDSAIAALRQSDSATDRNALANCLYGRGETKNRASALTGALADVQEALALVGTPRPDQRAEAINMRARVASIQGKLGNAAMAASEFRLALAELDAIGRGQTQASRTLYNNLGVLYYNAGRPLDASGAFSEAMDISRKVGHLDALTEGNFARVLIELGRFGEALPLAEHALKSLSRVSDSTLRATIAFFGAPAWCATGDIHRCESLLRQAREIFKSTPPQEKGAIPNLRLRTATLLEHQGDISQAREQMRRAAMELEGLHNRTATKAFALLARLDLRAGDLTAARRDADRAMKLARDYGTGFEKNAWHGSALLSYGMVQKALGQDGARHSLEAAVAELLEVSGASAPETLQAKAALANG